MARCMSTPMGAILDEVEQVKVHIRDKVRHPSRVSERLSSP